MSDVPKALRLVMFRHGVAYVERGGPAEGTFEMSFKLSEMNDVLKSLSVWVAAGEARIGAVAFEGADDPKEALAERNLLLDDDAVARGLLLALRGRTVAAQVGEGWLEGEVLGLEETPNSDGPPRRQLVLRSAKDQVTLVDLAQASDIKLAEAQSCVDLAFLVDRSRAVSTGAARSVQVQLTGAADDLRVAYVIPAPVWRVSYRLALTDESSSEGQDTSQAILMAWGIVHNPVDEALDDIELTLTTGQPVSFVIDLYHAKRVDRVVVEEKRRAASAPREFERGYGGPPPPAAAPGPPMAMAAPAPQASPAGAAGLPPPRRRAAKQMVDSFTAVAEDAASAVDRGELFEYRLSEPVSLKRGGSAMVPLATAQLKARKERIWRDGSEPNPDLLVTFDNDSELVLEEGPVVVYDDGGYAGEAMLPYSARGAEVKLGYAKDLAVRCRRDSTTHHEIASVVLGDVGFVQEQRVSLVHSLRAESDHDSEVEVIFELPKAHGRGLDPDGPKPVEVTASRRRFAVVVPGHDSAKVEVREVWTTSQTIEYRHMSAAHLESWLADQHLDARCVAELTDVLKAWDEAGRLDQERELVKHARQGAFDKQSKLSEQLGVLRDTGEEGKLRLRYVRELGEAQDEVNRCEDQIRELRAQAEAKRRQAEKQLAALTR